MTEKIIGKRLDPLRQDIVGFFLLSGSILVVPILDVQAYRQSDALSQLIGPSHGHNRLRVFIEIPFSGGQRNIGHR